MCIPQDREAIRRTNEEGRICHMRPAGTELY